MSGLGNLTGVSPQLRDLFLRNAQTSQTGTFQNVVASLVECERILTNTIRINDLVIDSLTVKGQITAQDFACTGLQGATKESRYVGGTVSGPPIEGTFRVGDYILASDGHLWICVIEGSPGTWSESGTGAFLPLAGGTMSGAIDMNGNPLTNGLFTSVFGVTGATTVTRYVGGTVSGPPVSGSYNVGDYVISQDGNVYIYRTGGTWNKNGIGSFLPLAGGTMSGTIDMNSNEVTGVLDLEITGITGANVTTRYVGGTVSGVPMTGMYNIGDYIISQDGNIYIYKTPGTWNQSGSGTFLPLSGGTMSGTIDMASDEIKGVLDLEVTGITGAHVTTRYVGGTSSGAPMTGTYSVGDYIVSQDGNIYIYKTPGTWVQSGGGIFLPLAGGVMSGAIDMGGHEVKGALDLEVKGVPDANVVSRYVGGTVSGAPMTGTFSVGDYIISYDGNVYVYKTGGTWSQSGGAFLPLVGGTMSGAINMNSNEIKSVSDFAVSGVSGATAASRYVGGTVSNAPVSGTFSVGDYVISQDGNMYIYKTGGTWNQSGNGIFLPLAGGTMSGTINMASSNEVKGALDLAVSGLSGATTATRYVGGTASGAPASGTFSTGDYVVSQDGNWYVCTSGGSPGTWIFVGQRNQTISASGSTSINGAAFNVMVNPGSGAKTLVLPDLTSSLAPNYGITFRVNLPVFTITGSGNPQSIRVTTNHVYIGTSGSNLLNSFIVRNFIFRLIKPSLAVDTTWDMNPNSVVSSMWDDGTYLYVGGSFSTVNGGATTRNNICRVLLSSTTGTVDATWDMNCSSSVLTLWGDSTNLYPGGNFVTVNGATTRNRICRCLLSSTTGTVDATWNLNAASTVNTIWGDSTNLYVGGAFTTVNGATTRNRICRVLLSSTTGTVDATWDMNCGLPVNTIWSDSTNLYVGGTFLTANGATTRNRICRCLLSSTTGTVDSWNLNSGGAVNAITGDGTNVYIGGVFTSVTSSIYPRVGLASVLLSSSTGAPTTFAPPNFGGTTINTNCLAYDSSSGILHAAYLSSAAYVPMVVNVTITSFNGTDTLNQRTTLLPYLNLVSGLQTLTLRYSSTTNWLSNNCVQLNQ
jgi:hypothetical protein